MYEHVVAEKMATDGTPFRVILEPDTDTFNPRQDYSNAGVIWVLPQSRYCVPREGEIMGIDQAMDEHDFRVVARWLRLFHGATVVLPLYSAGGREFNIFTSGDEDEWPEAGNYVGVTFDTPDTRRDTIGDGLIPASEEVSTMARALAADVETYHAWAEGDAWFYVVQYGEVDESGDITSWEQSDNMGAVVGGFIGQQWAEEAAQEALDEVVANYAARVADDEAELAGMAEARI